MNISRTKLNRLIPPAKRSYLRKKILQWYKHNKRHFPWRTTNNPYEVLIAEILLQQTDAAKVAAEYDRFIRLYPNPKELSKASKRSIRGFTDRLGLNYRVNRLICAARRLEDKCGGRVPDTEADLLELPGIGKYMANAVLACAFGKRTAVLDTNVVRIISRFFGIKSTKPRPRNDPLLWMSAGKLLPKKTKTCKQWTYALLDFGALVCSHYKPQCELCPCRRKCVYYTTLIT
jgi:A/G-specific adenine glycosylase